ncbi:MAG: hypothetical protein M0R74_02055 [Dehalococcoidia bacterium]|nr:hypothetical protein [Dehalococcoidia bacterium]
MSQPLSERAAGNIYDLGYRSYDGPRLGRWHAVQALYVQGLRAAFGLGRRTSSKIIPMALVIIAAIPAVIQLGVAAALDDIEVFRLEEYNEYIQVVLALFVAAVAPELLGRDMRNRTLSLYFSRPMLRSDYALAKLASLATAMLFLTFVPQTVMFVGNALAGNDAFNYFQDNADQLLRLTVTALVISLFTSAVALAIASMTPRRAYATGGIIAVFVLSSTIASILFATLGDDGRYTYLLGMYWLMRGATYWIFGAEAVEGDQMYDADIPGVVYFLVVAGVTALCTWYLLRRYERMAA